MQNLLVKEMAYLEVPGQHTAWLKVFRHLLTVVLQSGFAWKALGKWFILTKAHCVHPVKLGDDPSQRTGNCAMLTKHRVVWLQSPQPPLPAGPLSSRLLCPSRAEGQNRHTWLDTLGIL